jgi:hypothetical protein
LLALEHGLDRNIAWLLGLTIQVEVAVIYVSHFVAVFFIFGHFAHSHGYEVAEEYAEVEPEAAHSNQFYHISESRYEGNAHSIDKVLKILEKEDTIDLINNLDNTTDKGTNSDRNRVKRGDLIDHLSIKSLHSSLDILNSEIILVVSLPPRIVMSLDIGEQSLESGTVSSTHSSTVGSVPVGHESVVHLHHLNASLLA